ncbi:glycerophosphodiester phosphodiesterase [Paenibacillus koleovorans]|uniref:glycerophosphodiester phosphodiesterase n=1 Tax=Paenibacillus koleovorans TaxID=121608 RepID=UPI000FD81D67|nr:glycerophosphodiester phosphodiesterase [Paenibacillus koleovorans]
MTTQPFLIIAHRGAMGEAPENTLAAFRLGLEQGANAFELDIHMSADGEIIVCHDETVNRTTDGKGTIRSMTVAQLQKLDAGRWYHERFAGERLPLLEEVFDLVPTDFVINVEIKDCADHQLEPRLLELLKRTGRMESVVISSFDHKSLYNLKKLEPAIKVGLLYNSNLVSHLRGASAAQMPVYSLHPHFKHIDPEDIQELIQNGYQVYPWTVNSESDLRSVMHTGASGIITNFPARLKQLAANEMM